MYRPGGQIGGRSIPGFGELVLVNADGGLDGFLGHGWDARRVQVLLGGDGFAFSEFGTVFDGTAQGVEATDDQLIVRARDWRHKLDVPVLTNQYAGTGGAEGNSDLKGAYKPVCFGRCRNITPVLVEASTGLYQIHDGAIEDVDALHAGGVAYTKVGGTPAANQYSVNVSTGIVTVGGAPITEQVTCDAKGAKPTTWLVTVADIVEELVTTAGGFVAGDLDAASFTALNTANGATVGVYLRDQRSLLEVLDELLASVGGYYGFTRAGKFQVGRFEAPSGTPAVTFTDVEILDLRRQPVGLPLFQVRVGYQPNWTVQVEF